MAKPNLKKIMRSVSATPLSKAWSKFRRFFLCLTNKGYVEAQEENRSGECFSCGKCCMLPFRCPFLLGDEFNYRCGIYKDRPDQCRAFPIDERDLADVGFQCGYSFDQAIMSPMVMESPLLQIHVNTEIPSLIETSS